MTDLLPSILVVEDEPAQREVIAYNLRKAGYEVRLATTGDEAELELAEQAPDLLLLDWMLPGVSGLELCRRTRARKETRDVPIIMLTARGDEDDLVRGLETGADDYIAKPYSVTELLARVASLLRRSRSAGIQVLTFEQIEMNLEAQRVYVTGKEVSLGPLEFKLLQTFMERPGRVFDRDQLLDRVWGRDVYVGSRTVDVHIGRLRTALGNDAGDPIRTVRGRGYALG